MLATDHISTDSDLTTLDSHPDTPGTDLLDAFFKGSKSPGPLPVADNVNIVLISDKLGWPTWLGPAYNYLVGLSDAPDWQMVVQTYLTFEKALGFPVGSVSRLCSLIMRKMTSCLVQARLDCAKRPELVHQWLKNGRKYTSAPKILDVEAFAISWWLWWTALQPGWCKLEAGTLSKDIPLKGESWSELSKGGGNGLFMVHLTLGWWMSAEEGNCADVFKKALGDFMWVLGDIIDQMKSLDSETEEPLKKKRFGVVCSVRVCDL